MIKPSRKKPSKRQRVSEKLLNWLWKNKKGVIRLLLLIIELIGKLLK